MQILYALQRRSIPTTYTVEHSSKHAAFFSEEVQFPLRKFFSLRSIIQYFFQNTTLTLSIAVKMCSLQHSLKRNIVVKGNCCLQVTICLEDKIVPWTRSTVLAKKYMWKNEIHPFMELSLPLIFLLWPFFKRQTYMGRLGNENRTSTNHGGFEDEVFPQITSNILAEKE